MNGNLGKILRNKKVANLIISDLFCSIIFTSISVQNPFKILKGKIKITNVKKHPFFRSNFPQKPPNVSRYEGIFVFLHLIKN